MKKMIIYHIFYYLSLLVLEPIAWISVLFRDAEGGFLDAYFSRKKKYKL